MIYRYLRLRNSIPAHITMVVVSKQRSVDEIQALYEVGCRDFGENRLEEADMKQKALGGCHDIRWHMVGTIQTKKANKISGRFSLIHSVDSFRLAYKISQKSVEDGLKSSILIQINTSGEETKHGLTMDECRERFDEFLNLPGCSLQGLMTMAPQHAPEQITRQTFGRLFDLKQELCVRYCSGLPILSMGMSEDYKIAIEEGSTMVRIGSLIFERGSEEDVY